MSQSTPPMTTESYTSAPNGFVPNSRFPLLVHRGALPGGDPEVVRRRFLDTGWGNNWQYPGVYTYPHYHSTSHECLGCAIGWTEIRFFGEGGTTVRVEAGDVVVVPAGVCHEMTGNSEDNQMVGGYAEGRDWDNMAVDALTREMFVAAVKRIMMLPIPRTDPVTGGPLRQWLEAPSSVDAGLNDFRDALEHDG